jgi:hypothetical protein
MNEISNIDLLNLVLAQRSSIDLQFQFWLTITFAVVVASFTAGPRLIQRLRILTCALYILASAHIAARWYSDAQTAQTWIALLASRGVHYTTPWVAAGFRMALMVLGTAATVVFLFWQSPARKPGEALSEHR